MKFSFVAVLGLGLSAAWPAWPRKPPGKLGGAPVAPAPAPRQAAPTPAPRPAEPIPTATAAPTPSDSARPAQPAQPATTPPLRRRPPNPRPKASRRRPAPGELALQPALHPGGSTRPARYQVGLKSGALVQRVRRGGEAAAVWAQFSAARWPAQGGAERGGLLRE
ncbi:MAG: hypothetical protein WKG07_10295 [Hymenobacter sp.]